MKSFRIIILGLFILLSKTHFAQIISDTTGMLTWSLNTNDSTLTISGWGNMPNYNYSDNKAPWHAHKDSILIAIIKDSVTSIGDFAFYKCNRLISVTISDSVTSIGEQAFRECSSLNSITIPNSVTSIGHSAFYQCDSLENVTISNSITSIANDIFFKCNLKAVIIPNNVTSIGGSAFKDCGNLVSVTMPPNLTNIGARAFSACNNLTAITIPHKVTTIDDWAFYQCNSLTSVSIPKSVTHIGIYGFGECSHLQSIDVENDNPIYSSIDGILFNKLQTRVIQYPIGKANTSYTIPSSVTTIGTSAFRYCRLTFVTIPNSVDTIWDFAFGYCNNLASVTIGSNVALVSYGVFHLCTKLSSIYSLNENPPTVHDDNTFLNVNKNTCVLHVPAGSKNKYANAEGWKAFLNIQDDATGINEFTNDDFRFTIYPNPTSGQLRIMNYELREDADIQIYDVVGKLLQSKIVNLQSEITLDVSHLANGMYYLKIDGQTVKVIKD